MTNKGREIYDCFWSGADGEYLVDDPVNSECAEYMPKEVECDVFWSIVFLIRSPEPEAYEKERKNNWLAIRKDSNERVKPWCIYGQSRTHEFEYLSIERLKRREDSHICIDYSL